ncbi:MAG: putative toxin-antitoxin system toxin component, PIN family [Acidimicrobiales bacterium]
MLDPGVLVSALITPSGPPAVLWREACAGHHDLAASPHLLAELAEVLHREKFRRYVSVEEADRFVAEVAQLADPLAADTAVTPGATPDPDDDYLVALARTTAADAIVSGDRGLLGASTNDLPVLTPRQVVERGATGDTG